MTYQPMPEPGRLPDPGPLPDPGRLDPAQLHQTEDTRTYPCPACGGMLAFDPTTQDLGCGSCGNHVPLTRSPAVQQVAKRDLGATMNQLYALQQTRQNGGQTSLDKEIVCQSCGGRTTFTGSLSATRCPYCATPIQRDDLQDAPARLPIDGVLPFQVDARSAREQIDAWVAGRRFAPREFKTYREIGSFTSIYLSYFTYDAVTTTRYTGRRGENYTVTVGSGENRRTETRTNWYAASGVVTDQFTDLIDSANTQTATALDPEKVRALEPWPVQQAQPYSAEFVAGHLSRTYDADAAQVFEGTVRGQIQSQVESTIRRDIGGDQQQVQSRDIAYDQLAFCQLLLPVWLLTVTYQSKPFQVFINGVTGEVQGQRPYSAIKIALTVAAAVALLVVLYVLYRTFA